MLVKADRRSPPRSALPWLVLVGVLVTAGGAWAFIFDLTLVKVLHSAAAEHANQEEFYDLVVAGEDAEAFEEAFEGGDELFETVFNALDGGGANVGSGQRFTRVPRADLDGSGEWLHHKPQRATGPNAQACNQCHRQPADGGAGGADSNVLSDPLQTAKLKKLVQRNPPHLFAAGAVQRLAEEMTGELQAILAAAVEQACQQGGSVTKSLSAKGVSFGSIKVTRIQANPCKTVVKTSQVEGVDADLVVRPFGWKGAFAFLRDVGRSEAHEQLGMQAIELSGDGVDGDFDSVADELTVGDQTALAVHVAAQPRPTSKVELAGLGLIPPLSEEELAAIERGAEVFAAVGCAACHRPLLLLGGPSFSEPSQSKLYRDAAFPAGQDPIQRLVDPDFPVSFDLTRDQPDNVVQDPAGNVIHLGSLVADGQGQGIVDLYGDLRRHYMGSGLAEGIDEVGTGKATFLTENLWGVGSTAPYLHDGRATTLTEAILEHGGEAEPSLVAFVARTTAEQADLIAFLNNLVLFKVPRD